jgi:hypothetical protein
MRSKTRPRASGPAPRPARPNQALIAIVLVVIGATAALGFERLASAGSTGNRAGSSAGVPAASDLVSSDPNLPSDSGADAASGSPEPSPSPIAPVLDAMMPRSVGATTLTIETDLGSTILGNDPGSRSFGAAVSTLGVSTDKLEIAFGYDGSGSVALSVIGFRIPGIAPATLRPLVLEAWLSAGAPGVTSTTVTVGGTSATKVSYGDKGPDEYVFTHGDGVFIVETDDPAQAAAVVQAMPVAGSSAAPSGSAPASSAAASSAATPAAASPSGT